jgi:hypothetical protein
MVCPVDESHPVSDRTREMAKRLQPWLVVLGFGMLVVAWLFSDPASSAPDETAHYIKAYAAGRGDLVGSPGQVVTGGFTGRPLEWLTKNTRGFWLPSDLAPPYPCFSHYPARSAACLPATAHSPAGVEQTYVGIYPPPLYVLPGLLMQLAREPFTGYLLGRIGFALESMLLLAAAALALSGRAAQPRLAGLLLATTPMTVFLASALNPSGPEICAAIALTALLLRQTHDGGRSAALWAGIGLSGAVLATSRPGSPLWVFIIVTVVVVLEGPRRFWRVLRTGGTAAVVSALVIAVACLGAFGWTVVFWRPLHQSPSEVVSNLRASLREPVRLLSEEVGNFGQLDTPLPEAAVRVWVLGAAVLAAAALLIGNARERLALLAAAAALVFVTIVEAAILMKPAGFELQGRYVLPAAVILPLLSGELLYRHRDRIPWPARDVAWVILVVVLSGIQLVAWGLNARRNAVGVLGPRNFLVHPQWVPPGSWWPWLLLAVLGAASLLLAAVATIVSSPAAQPVREPPGRQGSLVLPPPAGGG